MPKRMSPRKPGATDSEFLMQRFDKYTLPWRIFRIMSEFIDGFEFVTEIKKPVTFFGSARTPESMPSYTAARMLAEKLGKAGFSVITGGGPGIMEAANRGATEAGAPSLGLNIQLPYEQRMNQYVEKGIGFHYFFSRKTMLSTSAQAYVFFPGGYGTLDELFTILVLLQTKKIDERPVILYGTDFWGPLDHFIKHHLLQQHQSIDAKDAELYQVVDTVDQAFGIIKASTPREYTFF